MAQIHGALISLDPSVDLSIVYRNYGRDFHNNLSNGFAENSKNINEKGIMIGIKLSRGKRLVMNAYLDQFKFPWLKYLVDKPNTFGQDYLVQLQYKPSRN